MAFEFPPTITDRKKKKKAEKKKKAKQTEKDFAKAIKPILSKKEGMPKEISIMQFEEATSGKNVGKGLDKKIMQGDMSSIKKIADAAADENQLARTERKMSRDLFRGGGRAMYKSGTRGCKLATKGKGRAYGKNS